MMRYIKLLMRATLEINILYDNCCVYELILMFLFDN
jgi:hypothetical protein